MKIRHDRTLNEANTTLRYLENINNEQDII